MIVLVTFVCSSPGWICAQNKTSQAFRGHGDTRHALVGAAGPSRPSRSRLGMAGHLLCGLGPHGPLLRSAKALLRPREDRQVLGGVEMSGVKHGVKHGEPGKSPIKIIKNL